MRSASDANGQGAPNQLGEHHRRGCESRWA